VTGGAEDVEVGVGLLSDHNDGGPHVPLVVGTITIEGPASWRSV